MQLTLSSARHFQITPRFCPSRRTVVQKKRNGLDMRMNTGRITVRIDSPSDNSSWRPTSANGRLRHAHPPHLVPPSSRGLHVKGPMFLAMGSAQPRRMEWRGHKEWIGVDGGSWIMDAGWLSWILYRPRKIAAIDVASCLCIRICRSSPSKPLESGCEGFSDPKLHPPSGYNSDNTQIRKHKAPSTTDRSLYSQFYQGPTSKVQCRGVAAQKALPSTTLAYRR